MLMNVYFNIKRPFDFMCVCGGGGGGLEDFEKKNKTEFCPKKYLGQGKLYCMYYIKIYK